MAVYPPCAALSAILVGFALAGSGCATVVHGTHQDIPIASTPEAAAVLVDGVRQGSTPMTTKLARKQNHVITLQLDGFETENVTITHLMSGAVAGNIVAGGLIGWGVDASNGAQYKLVPDSINIRLRPLPPPPALPAPRSAVTDLLNDLQKLDDLRKAGKLSDDEYKRLRASTLAKYSSEKS